MVARRRGRASSTHPLKGTGAGTFLGTNLRYRTTSLDQTIEPHDLPLQFLTETGVIGLALFGARSPGFSSAAGAGPGPQLALALALPAYFLHGLLDVDWDFASVSGPVFLIAGALVVRPSTGAAAARVHRAHGERGSARGLLLALSPCGSAPAGRTRPPRQSAWTTTTRSRSPSGRGR